MTDDHAACALQIAGLHERIEQLEQALATSQAENAALRTELCEFAAAVARDREAPSTHHDDDLTLAETPRSLAAQRERSTVTIPRETMREVVERGLR